MIEFSPIIESGGVRTDLIAGMHEAGDSVPEVAGWFGLDEFEVIAALEFEKVAIR